MGSTELGVGGLSPPPANTDPKSDGAVINPDATNAVNKRRHTVSWSKRSIFDTSVGVLTGIAPA